MTVHRVDKLTRATAEAAVRLAVSSWQQYIQAGKDRDRQAMPADEFRLLCDAVLEAAATPAYSWAFTRLGRDVLRLPSLDVDRLLEPFENLVECADNPAAAEARVRAREAIEVLRSELRDRDAAHRLAADLVALLEKHNGQLEFPRHGTAAHYARVKFVDCPAIYAETFERVAYLAILAKRGEL